MTDKNKRIIFFGITYLIVAALFAIAGYLYAKNKFKIPIDPLIRQKQELIQDSLAVLKEENANLYDKLSNIPDQKEIVRTKYKTITKTLYETVNTYEALPADQKLDAFASYLHKLPSYRTDTGYINSVQFK